MNKKILKILIIAIILCGIAFGVYSYSTQNSAASTQIEEYKEVTAKQGDIKINFLADGKAYLPVLKLRFPIGGQLKDVMFDTGDKVKEGDIIAKLEDKEYINKIESARINYNQAVVKLEKTKQQYESQLVSEKSKLDNLKFQLDSINLQYQPMQQIPEAYSGQEIESKKISFENAKAACESALEAYNLLLKGNQDITLDEINIQQTKISVKVAEDSLSDTILKSPVDGEVLASIRNRKIGFIFQKFNLLTKYSAVHNTEIPLILRGVKRKEARFKATELLNLVGLGERMHHKPTELSGGQQQRVAIARALVGAPELLLADEPTGNLDSKSGQEILDLFIKLNNEGNTIIIITHDLSVAQKAKRIIHVKDGKVS